MRNPDTWRPTKYVVRRNRLYVSSSWRRVGVSSRLIAQLVADAYEKYIPLYSRGDLADIGCGFVPMYEYYKQYVSSITTIDWPESFHANEHLDIVADLNTAPIPGVIASSYDTIILSDVLEHIYHPRILLDKLYRILKPGGRLLMNVPFYYPVHESPHDYHRYTEFALKRYLAEAGFEIVEFKPLGGVVACMIDIVSKGLCMIGVRNNKTRRTIEMVVRLPFMLSTALLQNIVCFLRNTYYRQEAICSLWAILLLRKNFRNSVKLWIEIL